MANPRAITEFVFSPIEMLLKKSNVKKSLLPEEWQQELKAGKTVNIEGLNFPITEEDAKWSGIEELNLANTPMTKGEMLNFINNNKINMTFETLSDDPNYGLGRELEREGLIQQIAPPNDAAFSDPTMASGWSGPGITFDDIEISPFDAMSAEATEQARARFRPEGSDPDAEPLEALSPDSTMHSSSSYNTPGPFAVNEESLLRYEVPRSAEAAAAQNLVNQNLSYQDLINNSNPETRTTARDLLALPSEEVAALLNQGKDKRFKAHTFGTRADELLAWSRTSSGVTPKGETFLFSQENQSDLHAGAKNTQFGGYRGDTVLNEDIRKLDMKNPNTNETIKQYRIPTKDEEAAVEQFKLSGLFYDDQGKLINSRAEIQLEQETGLKVHPSISGVDNQPIVYDPVNNQIVDNKQNIAATLGDSAPPRMPFSKNWGTIMSKKELGEAIETDKDYLVWPTGQMQNDRYGASTNRLKGMKNYYDGDKVTDLKKIIKQYGGKESDYIETFKPFNISENTFPINKKLDPTNINQWKINPADSDDYRIAKPEEESAVGNFMRAQTRWKTSNEDSEGVSEELTTRLVDAGIGPDFMPKEVMTARDEIEASGLILEPGTDGYYDVFDPETELFVDLKENIADQQITPAIIDAVTKDDINNMKQWAPHMRQAYGDATKAIQEMKTAISQNDNERYERAYETYKGISNGEKITWTQKNPELKIITETKNDEVYKFFDNLDMDKLTSMSSRDFVNEIFRVSSYGAKIPSELSVNIQNLVDVMQTPGFGGDNTITEKAGDLLTDLRFAVTQVRNNEINRNRRRVNSEFKSGLDRGVLNLITQKRDDLYAANNPDEIRRALEELYITARSNGGIPGPIVALLDDAGLGIIIGTTNASPEEFEEISLNVEEALNEILNPFANFAPNMDEDLMMTLNSQDPRIIMQGLSNIERQLGHGNLLDDVQASDLIATTPEFRLEIIAGAIMDGGAPSYTDDFRMMTGDGILADEFYTRAPVVGPTFDDAPPGMPPVVGPTFDDAPTELLDNNVPDEVYMTIDQYKLDVTDALEATELWAAPLNDPSLLSSSLNNVIEEFGAFYNSLVNSGAIANVVGDDDAVFFENTINELDNYYNRIYEDVTNQNEIPPIIIDNVQNELRLLLSKLEEYGQREISQTRPTTPAIEPPSNITIEELATFDDLNLALQPIQELLGIDDGGFAADFFDDVNWESMNTVERRGILSEYTGAESENLSAPWAEDASEDLLNREAFPTRYMTNMEQYQPTFDLINNPNTADFMLDIDNYEANLLTDPEYITQLLTQIKDLTDANKLPYNIKAIYNDAEDAAGNENWELVDDLVTYLKDEFNAFFKETEAVIAASSSQNSASNNTNPWVKNVAKYSSPSFHAIKISPEVRNKYNAIKKKTGAGFSQYIAPFAIAPGAWEMYQQMQEEN